MTKLLTITLTVVALTVGFTTDVSAAPSFDSDCVGTQWVIRNRGLEPFLVATPAGDPIGMIELGAVWEPDDNLNSVIISDTVIVRPSCEVFAAAPAKNRLPDTGAGASLALAALALGLVAAGALALRVARTDAE